jgi:hypothetical protein
MTAEAVDAAQGERRRVRVPTLTRSDADFDLRNTWQIAAGAILLPLGLIVILLAWYGAAHARVVQQQIPYMVSGAFIGLGLMMAGGLMFWAHWLYRIYDQADLQHRELLAAIERLSAGGGGNGAMPVVNAGAGAPAGRLVATATGTNFHRPDCSVVKGRRGVKTVTATQAAAMEPCRICEPLVH